MITVSFAEQLFHVWTDSPAIACWTVASICHTVHQQKGFIRADEFEVPPVRYELLEDVLATETVIDLDELIEKIADRGPRTHEQLLILPLALDALSKHYSKGQAMYDEINTHLRNTRHAYEQELARCSATNREGLHQQTVPLQKAEWESDSRLSEPRHAVA